MTVLEILAIAVGSSCLIVIGVFGFFVFMEIAKGIIGK